MKREMLFLGLSSLFLFGCTSKVEELTYADIENKIGNYEDFILLITSKNCSHCQNLKKTIKASSYDFNVYNIDIDSIIKGVENNDLESIEIYKKLATQIDYSFSNVTSYSLNETYESFVGMDYEAMYGKDTHLKDYINIVFPLTFFYNDGEIINFEVGDFSYTLDKVFEKYNIEKDKIKEPIDVEKYLTFINFNELKIKIENKEDFIFILSSEECSYCNKQYKDLKAFIPSLPYNFTCFNIDDVLINLEVDDNNKPYNQEKYEEAKTQYRYFASLIESVWNYQKDTVYVEEMNTDRFGEKEPSVVYPVTFMFINGEVSKEFSYLGYGWSEELDTYKSFVNLFNSVKDF